MIADPEILNGACIMTNPFFPERPPLQQLVAEYNKIAANMNFQEAEKQVDEFKRKYNLNDGEMCEVMMTSPAAFMN